MIAGAVKSEQPPLEAGIGRQQTDLPRNETKPYSDIAPDRTCLQAIHASQRGVILKGKCHETFWEW